MDGKGYHAALFPVSVTLPIMSRSKSSSRWLREHFDDVYVKKAQAEGLRSRAVYKLEELIERDRLLKPGIIGGRSGGRAGQLVATGSAASSATRGKVFALDILPMQSIAGVDFLQGDFREEDVSARSWKRGWRGRRSILCCRDLAPNMSGVALADQIRSMDLAELALDFSRQWLKPGGSFLIKLFQGVGFDDYLRSLRADFTRVTMRKPKASRARSREVYALAVGLKSRAVRNRARTVHERDSEKCVALADHCGGPLRRVPELQSARRGFLRSALQRVCAERGQRQRCQRHHQCR